ncbi:outer membrane protein S [Vibrio inusitatus NBRC 102082]|uniref:Outer membrane protein S n=1 Tax=Vibrio inusitatus NBRC 102082 TaxID=1219070 RepID=A0A4Y3I0L7_9VIBR|nr:carbohydrate porin [Vibrio inusitatus]GEA52785.1 outer membrane protein S [Vibrio inusitatus NBRC 102082]
MKQFKFLPVSLAVAATLAAAPALADSELEELKQRLAELEAKQDTSSYVDDQQPLVLSSKSEVPEGVVFTGYARYGMQYAVDDATRVTTDGALTGNSTGRLGNEDNGGEFQFGKFFESDSGAIWDVQVMLEHWQGDADGDAVGLKKFYAGATNLFESQEELYIWAGRDFHQRPQTDLNDYFWMMHDGQGGGFYNLDLGGVMFDMSVVGQVDGASVGDNGRYAVTSKLHGISLGEADVSFYANYGFTSEDDLKNTSEKTGSEVDAASSAYQLVGQVEMYNQNLIVRYSNNSLDSVFDLAEDQTALLVSFDGRYSLTEQWGVEYLAGYQSLEGKDVEDRVNTNVIVRPAYAWNDTHSTWLEMGYSVVDFDEIDATNSSWKTTLSQNIAFGDMGTARPMLRFYATVGNSDNEYTINHSDPTYVRDEDTLTVGAMFEAWW